MVVPHEPSAPKWLKERASLLKAIRCFFERKDILEVDTPILGHSTVTDVHLDSIKAQKSVQSKQSFFLQTSPEFYMKRLLSLGAGSIYQMCKVFRDEEDTLIHRAEFTLLEWYHMGFDHHQLMAEVDELLQIILNTPTAEKMTYQALFIQYLDLCPFTASIENFANCAEQQGITLGSTLESRDEWLFLLLAQCIEPKLGFKAPVMVYDYPCSQASLARLNASEDRACRFEVYIKGIELANGFWELSDEPTQRARFKQDNQLRSKLGKPLIALDENFLGALKQGLPNCAGVALGVDRLMMLKLGLDNIKAVLPL